MVLQGNLTYSRKWSPDGFGTFCASHNYADLTIFECLTSSEFLKRAVVRVS